MNTAVAERRAVTEGLAPCPRCAVVHIAEGPLGEHLKREHLMGEFQARREAHEAATGIARNADGDCIGCKRALGQGHAKYCYVAQRAERRGYRADRNALRWDGRVFA